MIDFYFDSVFCDSLLAVVIYEAIGTIGQAHMRDVPLPGGSDGEEAATGAHVAARVRQGVPREAAIWDSLGGRSNLSTG